MGDKPQYAYVIELHRHSDRKKITTQLLRHVDALKAGCFAPQFGQGSPYFVLSVYAAENVAVMRQVIDSLKADKSVWPYIERYFLFAEMSELVSDFYGACGYFGAAKKPIPPLSTGRSCHVAKRTLERVIWGTYVSHSVHA